jgi:hypothetical protein
VAAGSREENRVKIKEIELRFLLDRNRIGVAPIARSHAGTPITFQRGLNLDGIPDDPTSAEKIEKVIASEQYGVVASLSQLETIDAPALRRSNQTAATLFDKGRNDSNGE